MTLSVLCVTNGEPHALDFLARMSRLSQVLECEFVIGLDNNKSQLSYFRLMADKVIDLPDHEIPLQEMVLDMAVNECSADYVLRLDDDESVSPSLEKWLLEKEYEHGDLYTFPRVYLYPDDKHILCNAGIYPDLQTRLGKRKLMLGVNIIHAGNPNGAGQIIYKAIEHHKLLVRTLEQRKEIADRYESIRVGAGTYPEYARYNLPEMIYGRLETRDYTDGDYS